MTTLYKPYTLTRGDQQIDLEVEFEITPFISAQTYGLPEHCSPAEGGEIDSIDATLDGHPFTLTSTEMENLERWLYENTDEEDFISEGPDYD